LGIQNPTYKTRGEMEMVGFLVGAMIGVLLGAFIICCLVVGDDEIDSYHKIIETYDKEVNRQYKVIKKAKRQIEILLEIALEQDSENVNLIDRLKGIIEIMEDKND